MTDIRLPVGRTGTTTGMEGVTPVDGPDLSATSKEQYRLVVESMAEAGFLLDDDGRIEFVTPSWRDLTGYPPADAVGRPIAEFVDAEDRPALAAALEEGRAGYRPVRHRARCTATGGGTKVVELRCRPIVGPHGRAGMAGTLDDVTERQRLEMDLLQAQKLESVGRLAAGIAHEINTPIQFVGDNLHFLEDAFASVVELLQHYRDCLQGSDGLSWDERRTRTEMAEMSADVDYLVEEVPQAVSQALEGVRRVADIVRAMRAFGHRDQTAQQAFDVNEGLRNTLAVARNETKYVADVELDLVELPQVTCYPGDLNQVFLNLVVNAAHAIEEATRSTGQRGRITVRTRRDGADVVITVADTGVGIPPEVQAKVFDPFFTTKPLGKGTGQGLALSRSVIVEKHGGSLTFETSRGEGTAFHVRVPISGLPAKTAEDED